MKLLRQLKHPDIVEIKHILLPPNPREFKDIYVVFELMETDLHQVIKANDDLTQEHHQFFRARAAVVTLPFPTANQHLRPAGHTVYQMLRGLKYVHSGACSGAGCAAGSGLTRRDCALLRLCAPTTNSQRVPPRPQAQKQRAPRRRCPAPLRRR